MDRLVLRRDHRPVRGGERRGAGQANTRGETVAGSLAYALAEGLLVAVAVVLTVYAASGRFAGWQWLLGVPLGITLVIGALIGLSL